MPARLSSVLAVPLVGTVLLAGCGAGDVIDPRKTEIAVKYDVEGATSAKVESVSCPSDVPVGVGNRFTCRVETVGGDVAVAELEITSTTGDLEVLSLEKP